MLHTELYCPTLDQLDRTKAIRAIHQAWLQLTALTNNVDCEDYDNLPAIKALGDCLRDAGHPAFTAPEVA